MSVAPDRQTLPTGCLIRTSGQGWGTRELGAHAWCMAPRGEAAFRGRAPIARTRQLTPPAVIGDQSPWPSTAHPAMSAPGTPSPAVPVAAGATVVGLSVLSTPGGSGRHHPRLDRRRPVRVRRQLGHQHRQRLLRRPAVQPVAPGPRTAAPPRPARRPGDPGRADPDRREGPRRAGRRRLADLRQAPDGRRDGGRHGCRPASPRSRPPRRSRPDEAGDYTVRRGDTVAKIAAAHGQSWRELYRRNVSVIGGNPDVLRPGQVLVTSGRPRPSPLRPCIGRCGRARRPRRGRDHRWAGAHHQQRRSRQAAGAGRRGRGRQQRARCRRHHPRRHPRQRGRPGRPPVRAGAWTTWCCATPPSATRSSVPRRPLGRPRRGLRHLAAADPHLAERLLEADGGPGQRDGEPPGPRARELPGA